MAGNNEYFISPNQKTHIQKDMNMQRPPPLELDAIHTTAQAPPGFEPAVPTTDSNRYNGPFGTPRNTVHYQQVLQNFIAPLEAEYQARAALIPQNIETDLAATRLEGSTQPLPPAAAIIRELGVRNTVIQRKSAEQQRQTALSHGFYGSDPTHKTVYQFLSRAFIVDKVLSPNGPGMNLWKQSYRAAHEARLLSQTITVLNQQHINVLNWLAAVQSEEQARLAAQQQAQQLAAELQRQAAEAEARRIAAEEEARRIARLAALLEAQRLADEQARLAAEAAAQQVAVEQARLEALAQAQREAEQARLEAEQQEQRRQFINNHSLSGLAAGAGPAFSVASRALPLNPAITQSILTALRSALMMATAASAAMLGPVVVGFAALLAPSRLGNGERFSMSVPLAELTSQNAQSLRAIADRRGTLEMPMRLGYRFVGSGAELFVVTAAGDDQRSNAPVLDATYDPQNGVYTIALTGSPSDTLTWTPIVTPGNSSTERPVVHPDAPTYSGAPIIPLKGRVDLHPALGEEWDKFVVVFPDDSGIAPLYVVVSSPYEGAKIKGTYSGRYFNPDQAGDPILDLNWRTAIITQEGINAVKLHIARLDQSDANDIMIQRLEKIIRQQSLTTDTDLRYYTHEIRELERFRALGLRDDFKPDKDSPIWNNAHTATLEDYKLGDIESLLYTEEAIKAADRQEERFFNNFLKGGVQ
ncbi:S-type pyocin domain-containing protein [Pseudomonas sp. RT6P73]